MRKVKKVASVIEISKLNENTTLLRCNSCGNKKGMKQIIVKYGEGCGAGGLCLVFCETCRKELVKKLNES